MIGLDTNVLVRYLVQDDPTQSRRASALIDRAAAGETPMYINHVVMCELAWVLGRGYGYARTALAEVIEKILLGRQFEIEKKDLAWAALAAFKASRADFANCLIAVTNSLAGCESTLTFDRSAVSLPAFKQV
ncbi:MAG: type II toxin-antitoxin system VapC family toxin [Casimicrobiaceae bacterium]